MLITKHEEVTKQGFSKIHGRLFEVGANSRLGAYSNKYGMVHPGTHLTCEKSWVPVHNQWVPVKKKKNESKIENAWAFM